MRRKPHTTRSIMHDFAFAAALFGPLFFGLILHGISIKLGWFRALLVPIDRGAKFRGQPLFGANKTYRGVVLGALGAAGGYALQGAWPALQVPELRDFSTAGLACLGFGIGAAAMVSELLNSFLKRQIGIQPGAPAAGPSAVIFYVFDQVDFLLGAWIVVLPWVTATVSRVLWSIAFVTVIHQIISLAGARLGMRSSAR